MSLKTGLLGGTFDPPHDGHTALAQAARRGLGLDEVLLVPAFQNPLKEARPKASARDRLRMCSLAVADEEGLAVCDVEIVRRGFSYTVDTLDDLANVRPAEYWLILGVDALRGFPRWKQPAKILRLCRLAVAAREGESVDEAIRGWDPDWRARVDTVPMPNVPVSSSKIRDELARGRDFDLPLSPGVLAYIRENGIYRP
jgi:nicotinate-nucleotide adenylyltransferase